MRLTEAQRRTLDGLRPELRVVLQDLEGVEARVQEIFTDHGASIEALRRESHGEVSAVGRKLEADFAALRVRMQGDYAGIHGQLHRIANFYYDIVNRLDEVIEEAEANASTLPVQAVAAASPPAVQQVGSGQEKKT